MTNKEKILFKHFFNQMMESINHGCCDVWEPVFENWTLEEHQNFVKGYYEFNGDPENYNPDHLELGDCSILAYLGHKILQ